MTPCNGRQIFFFINMMLKSPLKVLTQKTKQDIPENQFNNSKIITTCFVFLMFFLAPALSEGFSRIQCMALDLGKYVGRNEAYIFFVMFFDLGF